MKAQAEEERDGEEREGGRWLPRNLHRPLAQDSIDICETHRETVTKLHKKTKKKKIKKSSTAMGK